MKENIKPPVGDNQTGEKTDFSIYKENYKQEQEKIAKLEKQIMEKKKILETSTNTEEAEKVKKEIETLKREKEKAQYQSGMEQSLDDLTARRLEEFDPFDEGGVA